MKFFATDPADVQWDALDGFRDRMFSQRRGWLEFIAGIANGTPVIAELKDGGETVGCFSGVLFRRFGVPILGSPFQGWTTTYMGFNLLPGVSRRDALLALREFAFGTLGCLHLEVLDRHFTMADVAGLDADIAVEPTYISSLEPDEDRIFATMSSACRRCIRKGEKNGLIVEEAEPDGFADEYYAQLIEVFAKQGLTPPYTQDYVQALIDKVHPTGDALLLRVRTPDGLKIASAIYFGHKEHSLFWGNGSLQSHQILRPNEALHWYALRYWKSRGVRFHDWCGPDDYKRKYGPEAWQVPRVRISRFRALKLARNAAYNLYTLRRTISRRKYQKSLEESGDRPHDACAGRKPNREPDHKQCRPDRAQTSTCERKAQTRATKPAPIGHFDTPAKHGRTPAGHFDDASGEAVKRPGAKVQ